MMDSKTHLIAAALFAAGLLLVAGCSRPPAPYGALPSQAQLAWQKQEMLMFYHFGQATFSGYDGANSPTSVGIDGWTEDLLLENYRPDTVDTDQWVRVAAQNGFRGIIITAKHHDGFCLWDNPESTADIANPGCFNHTDVLQGLREACSRYGVAMGIYLSPWDRMIETAGTPTGEYEASYKRAVRDLMTRYAPVSEFWFDGNHAGSFDWPSVHRAVLDVNPHCIIFSDGGPGCRWVGNERGVAGQTNWSTLDIAGRGITPGHAPGDHRTYLGSGDCGAPSWCPAECDFSIQRSTDPNGWFYGASDPRLTASDLMDIYYKTVGRNGVFLMNVPPSPQGVLDSAEVRIIGEFTRMREAVFSTDLAAGATASSPDTRGRCERRFGPRHLLDGDYDRYFCTDDGVTTATIDFALAGQQTFNRVLLQEYIPLGQRVSGFEIEVLRDGVWTPWASGTTIGYKRILCGPAVTTDAVRVKITSALAAPVLNTFSLHLDTVSGF